MKQQKVTLTDLIAFASGDLTGPNAAMVEAYLSVVPEAARTARRLQEVIETLRADDTVAPTPQAVRRALGTLQPRPAAPTITTMDCLAPIRVLARLVFDSRHQPALAGYRGYGSSCQLAYESHPARVDLQIGPHGTPRGTWRLRGQVTSHLDAVVDSVSLLQHRSDRVVATVVPDGPGRFKIESAPGVYDLLIELDRGTRTVLAQGLEVGQELV